LRKHQQMAKEKTSTTKSTNQSSLFLALIPIVILISLLGLNVALYGSDATNGPNQLALLIGAAIAVILGFSLHFSWNDLLKGIVKSIKTSLSAVLILLIIGALTGTWMLSGVVPTMIYYGLSFMNPQFFLVASVLVATVISISTGSSWTTVGTVGVALIGIAHGLGIPTPIVAGAIISGAYFGDKISPLSDTTNLASAIAGTDLFTHIKYMMYTTTPTYVITLIIFTILGFTIDTHPTGSTVDELMLTLSNTYYISPILFVVPALVIFLILKKMDAVPALFIGTIAGAAVAIIAQPDIVQQASGIGSYAKNTEEYITHAYKAVVNAMSSNVSIQSGNTQINELIETNGMQGMLNTVWLIICAMTFGGAMEATGFLKKITSYIVRWAQSSGSLIASTVATSIFFNVTASDQYLAIVVPGKMFQKVYKKRGLKPENLSRSLEDSGTVTSALVPWNTCAAFHTGMLGVATGEYFFYAFFNWISPLMSVLFGYFNIKIRRYSAEEMANFQPKKKKKEKPRKVKKMNDQKEMEE
jgi:Na+:H+ antiporter, NhaC family